MTAYSCYTLVIYVKAFLIVYVESSFNSHFLQHYFLNVCLIIIICTVMLFNRSK